MSMPPEVSVDPILTIDEAAAYLAIPESTLYTWRTRRVGFGPRALKIGGCLRFRRSDLDEWVEAQLETVNAVRTSEREDTDASVEIGNGSLGHADPFDPFGVSPRQTAQRQHRSPHEPQTLARLRTPDGKAAASSRDLGDHLDVAGAPGRLPLVGTVSGPGRSHQTSHRYGDQPCSVAAGPARDDVRTARTGGRPDSPGDASVGARPPLARGAGRGGPNRAVDDQ